MAAPNDQRAATGAPSQSQGQHLYPSSISHQHQHHLHRSSPSASSSDSGNLEEHTYSSTTTANSSGPSSPRLYSEKESQYLSWQHQEQQEESIAAPLMQRLSSRRPHARNFSEQIVQSVEKITLPIREKLNRVAPGIKTDDHGRSSRSRTRLTSLQLKWMVRALIACTTLLFISAVLPRSSHLSLWRALADRPLVHPEYDSKNQRLAAGKGWGWHLDESLREGSPGGAAAAAAAAAALVAPEDATLQQHEYAYGSQAAAEAETTAAGYPDIHCQLDVPAFAHHYKLTSNFKYTRRYVTAKPQAPDVNLPTGFDPQPRELSDSLVKGWSHLSWRGLGVSPKELCKSLTGKAHNQCVDKEAAKQQQNGFTKRDDAAAASSSSSSSSSRARLVAEKRVSRGASSMTSLDSCSSSLEPLEMPTYPVPRTRTQPHHLILGLATDVERVFDLMPELSYSFAYSNMHLLLNLPPDSSKVAELRKALRARGIRATLIQSTEEDYLRRWVELPSLLADFADPSLTRWAMVADDDTFWLSVPKLLKMLDKYDYTRSHYIGALTDDWRQSDSGMIAYGGGGVVLSMPLLDELQPHWASCKDSKSPGDHRLAQCIYANTHTRLTIEWGLLQTDLHGDIRGLLESGKDITTMHHWRSWNTGFDPVLIARAGAVCGSECLLQRFISNGSSPNEAYMLVHGLSLSLYPTPLPDFSKTEVTWKVWHDSQFAHAMGPTRQRLREGRPPLSGFSSGGSGSALATRKSQSAHWRETWTLEDVRLDTESGPASSWDHDGRGIREIYIKRANRPKGYLSTSVYSSDDTKAEGSVGGKKKGSRVSSTTDVEDDADADDETQSPADKHRELESNVKGLVGKIFSGLGLLDEAEEQRQADLVRQELQQEEEDSVIELVWI